MSVARQQRKRRILIPGQTQAGGGLILPGSQRPRGAAELLVPRGYETGEVVLVGHCLVPGCGQKFFKGQEDEWQRHVGECARANLDDILHAREQEQKTSIFNEDNWDPEVAEHMRKVGETMLREGRLTVKPSERAGF